MDLPGDFLNHLAVARRHFSEKNYTSAEKLYFDLLDTGVASEGVQRELLHLYMAQGDLEKSIWSLESLCALNPKEPDYYLELISVARRAQLTDKCISTYERYLELWPQNSDSQFNLAWLLRQRGDLEGALYRYGAALEYGISACEEVYTNMAVICSELRRESEAEELLNKAVSANNRYIPALFNLGGIMEERGSKDEARILFQEVLNIDPHYSAALCRLVYLDPGDQCATFEGRLRNLLQSPKLSLLEKEEVYFALGKFLDDCGEYDRAFHAYVSANETGRKRFTPYSKEFHESYVADLMESFDKRWPEPNTSGSGDFSPIFICGMLRSGSTLLEKSMAQHSCITAGDELDFFSRFVRGLGDRYPGGLLGEESGVLERAASDYRLYVNERLGQPRLFTDKRPDNFLHLGLIKTVFPSAKIIWTKRGLLDNCLSIYFQQLGAGMSYSVDLESIAHYYQQQIRLMEFWKTRFPGSIEEVQYEAFVASPRENLERILNFVGLEWEDACLDFSRYAGAVKTASVWQVRKPIYLKSSERYKNYQAYLKPLQKYC
ncbi:tetratricopeptide repeat-containing sulfotransferase family protein [Microbulbifer sp.]|uniref:tetratricopeptide repeat-containing sulfotransferase family protein n=1 Tax=Microbulbifer sp. TaxID=1908541 RepID=UPI00258D1626|nr:tetratricopeptide repeat-containing sulfotransferase family protein [Microbulbifer sp.]